MKSMWNSYRSIFLVVHIKQQQRQAGWVIPLALPVLQATLESINDSLQVWECIFPALFNRLLFKNKIAPGKKLQISQLFTWSIGLLDELRRNGKYELVNVENGENHISVKLW